MSTQTMDMVDLRISRTIKALLSARGETVTQLASSVGMPAATLYRRLHTGLHAADLANVADALDVTVQDLYDGLGGKLPPVTTVDPRPADYESAALTN